MERITLRPALAAKLQEYLARKPEFDQLIRLEHRYLKEAWLAGHHGPHKTFQEWRDEFAKEEYERHKRERSKQP